MINSDINSNHSDINIHCATEQHWLKKAPQVEPDTNTKMTVRSKINAVLLCIAGTFAQTIHSETIARITFDNNEIALLKSFAPWPPAVPDDPGNELSGIAWAERLGEKLFVDPGLSGDGEISCATCHHRDKAFSDGRATAIGADTHHRNTQGLLNVGYQRWFGWDGGTDSLWAASLRPLLSDIEMNSSVASAANYLRAAPYVQTTLSSAGIIVANQTDDQLVVIAAKALGAFQRTLISDPTGFDRFVEAIISGDTQAQDTYPEPARAGMKLFFGEGNCHVCHFGPDFSNGEFHDTGRPFFTSVGQVDPGRYAGIKRLRSDRYNLTGQFNGAPNDTHLLKTLTVKLGQTNFGQWRTPGLRNLTLTAPYMHDGSLTSLRQVVDSYADVDPDRLHSQGESLIRPLDWNEQDRQSVVAFLKTLSP